MSLENLKTRIKDDIPISHIIGQYLSLKKSGTNLVAVCPFHNDKKPSLQINDHLKMYKCFACTAVGDSIKFVQEYRKLDFIEALKEICNKNGIAFESYQENRKTNPKIEMAKKLLQKTTILYRKISQTKKYEAYNQFIVNRKLNEETANLYSLGFATSKNSLTEYLQSINDQKEKEFAINIALEIGLIKIDRNDASKYYDTFRDRIIFPIWDHYGQVIGYTSRATLPKQEPKYLNSKESFVFNKGQILFGLHLVKADIRQLDAVIIVEGNMDQIALYHHGFKNTVAIMGTAMSQASIERILSFTKVIYLALDSDDAGINAMKRINQQFMEKGIIPKFIEFLPEKDPDDFLKAQGGLKLQEKINNAISAVDYILQGLIPEKTPEVLDRKIELLNKAFEVVQPLGENIAATERISSFAKKIGLSADAGTVIKNYQEFLKKNGISKANIVPKVTSEEKKDEIEEEILSQIELSDTVEIEKNNFIPLTKIEKLILQETVQKPALLNAENIDELLDLITHPEVKIYIENLSRIILEIDENEYVAVVSNHVQNSNYSKDFQEVILGAIFNYKPKDIDKKIKMKIIDDLNIKLKIEKLMFKKLALKESQKKCETDQELHQILTELSNVERELNQIKK